MSKGNIATLERSAVLQPDSRWRIRPSWVLSINAVKKAMAVGLGKDALALNLLAFLLGRVVITGELMPFGLAFFIAVSRKIRANSVGVGFWALAGSLSAGYLAETGWYAAVMLVYHHLSGRQDRLQERIKAVPLFIGVCIALIGAAMLIWKYITLYQLMLVGFNIAACFALSIIFSQVMPLLTPAGVRRTGDEQFVCLIIVLSAAIAGIGPVQLMGYSLRNVLGSFFIMAMAMQGGVGISVAVGTAVGVVTGLNDGSGAVAVAHYAVAALLGGAFNSMGKLAVSLGYLTGCIISAAYFTLNGQMLTTLIEAAAGGLLFLAIPGGWLHSCGKAICRVDEAPAPERALTGASVKLGQVSELFAELAAAFDSSQPGREHVDDVRKEVDRLGGQVCKECSKREYCWEQQFYGTYQAFLDLLALPPNVKLSKQALPGFLQRSCQHQQELVSAAAEMVEHKRVQLFWQRQLLEFRALLAEQMRSAGGIIAGLAAEIQETPQQDRVTESMLIEALRQSGCELHGVKVTGKGRDMLIVGGKQPCGGDQECVNKIAPLVAETVGKRLLVENHCGSKMMRRKCRLAFTTANRFAVSVGAASIAKGFHCISGDTCLVAEAGQGRVAAIISDGMGSGEAAANESRAAVRFLEKLLAAEFSLEAAVKTVNAMLLLQTTHESYATMDVAIIDLFSGEAEFLKTGSAASYIKRVREVSAIQSTSLPVGILEHMEIEPQRRKLAAGDTLIMISDGVAEADRKKTRNDWAANYLRLAPDDDPQVLANLILEQAQKLAGAAVRDDMTVLVIKIHDRLGTM